MKSAIALTIAVSLLVTFGANRPASADAAGSGNPSLQIMNEFQEHSLGATFGRDADEQEGTKSADAGWLRGMDISYWQGDAAHIGWKFATERGATFTYVKVSEGSYGGIATRYAQQREAARSRGLYTGPYHFANPNRSYASGADQARLFAGYSKEWHTTGNPLWAPGEKSLPPMVDLEWNPYPEDGDDCYDRTPAEMVAWIHDFVDTASELFGRAPVIYTSASWWSLCTGNSPDFGDNPLSLAYWTADKAAGPAEIPVGWTAWTFWQHGNDDTVYTPAGELLPGDQQFFNSTAIGDLESFANSGPK
ncbi:GH25 family lysozyme [Herbiconiux sp. UC225_62]|uniref:GH25 family lysozyme n=1 Tax=Herbiconiux sp. UC225_62 TaxID=3350168 RepID=UPI0036D2616F